MRVPSRLRAFGVAKALDYLEHETVDVVLTDVSMPVMTGLELAIGIIR